MTPVDITIMVLPIIVINLTLLLFFAARSEEKLDKILKLKEKYLIHLSNKLADLYNKIDEKKLDAFEITLEMNDLLDIYYDMTEFRCDYNYKCGKGILRILAVNIAIIGGGWALLLMAAMVTDTETIIIYSLGAGAFLIWSVYNIGCGIFKAIKEGVTLTEFEKQLS